MADKPLKYTPYALESRRTRAFDAETGAFSLGSGGTLNRRYSE